MCITKSALYRLMFVIIIPLLLVGMTATAVLAQTATTEDVCATAQSQYASWLDKLESLRGTLTVANNENGREGSAEVIFAIVNTGELEQLDYFIQAHVSNDYEEESNPDYTVFFAKDNFVAGLRSYGGWDVVPREEAYDVQSIEKGFFRANDFLKTAFEELRLLQLSSCLGSEIIAERATIHYRLDVPPMLARMLASQLAGSVPDDVEFGEVGFDFWLDKTDGYIVKIEGNFEAIEANSGISIAATLELNSVNNVQLKVPEYIRVLAMQRGLIEPDFTQEFIAVGE